MKKIETQTFEAVISSETVDDFSDKVRVFLSQFSLSSREIARYSLTVEEVLLKTLDCAQGSKVVLSFGKKFMRPFVSVAAEGASENIFSGPHEVGDRMGKSLLKNLGLAPDYLYVNGFNTYVFRIKAESKNTFRSLIIAIAAALATGFAGLLLDQHIRSVLLEMVLAPVSDVFFNVLGAIAGPMIFLSIAWGIYGIGDSATLKSVGKHIIGGYFSILSLAVLVFGVATVPFYNFDWGTGTGGENGFFTIFQMILNIFPKNIFSPFIDGNTLQIIFLGVIVGLALLFLEQKTSAIAIAIEQINSMIHFLVGFISNMVPFFIYIILVKVVWSDSIAVFARMSKMFFIFIGSVLAFSVVTILLVAVRNKVSPVLLIKKGIPVLVIAITTASSAAAFGTNLSCCKKKLGIKDMVASFGIPLGIVVFKPTSALSYIATVLIFTELYGVKVSVSWFVTLFISVLFLAVATPPIPGGAMTTYVIMFLQFGIPQDALAIALACDALFDFIATGMDQFLMPIVLMNSVSGIGLVDREKLEQN